MSGAEQRSSARLAAVQALYQMEVADKGLNDILAEFEAHWIGQEVEGDQYKPAELAFFRDVVSGVQGICRYRGCFLRARGIRHDQRRP
jgi:N utilization substance protein B